MVEGPCRGDTGAQSPLGAQAAPEMAPIPGLGKQLLAGLFLMGPCCLCGWKVLTVEWGLPQSVTSMPCVFQIPQVLVKLKKYPQGEKVS